MEELLGLWVSAETPMAMRLVFLALAGLVDGKPMRITLWMGAKRPNLGGHWKYLGEAGETHTAVTAHGPELPLASPSTEANTLTPQRVDGTPRNGTQVNRA